MQNSETKGDEEGLKGARLAQVKVKKACWKPAFELNTAELGFQYELCPELKKVYKKTMKPPILVVGAQDLSAWETEEGRA